MNYNLIVLVLLVLRVVRANLGQLLPIDLLPPSFEVCFFLSSFTSPFRVFHRNNFSRCFTPRENDGSCSKFHRISSASSASSHVLFFVLSAIVVAFAPLALRPRITSSLTYDTHRKMRRALI